MDKETGYRTRNILTVPLFSYRGEIAGVVQLLNKKEGDFKDDDAEFLKEVGAHAATLLENAQMQEKAFSQMRIEKEIQIAQEVQKRLLPECPSDIPGLKISLRHFGDNIIGGNYFDFIPLSEKRLWMVLSDTSGAGLPAALLASNFQGAFRLLAEDSEALLPMVMRLNRHFCYHSEGSLSISAAILDFQQDTSVLGFVNAGHPAPILLGGSGDTRILEETGIALGMESDYPYEDGGVEISSGSILAVYTPGIVEADDGEGHFYGIDRLRMVLELNRDKDPEGVLDVFAEDWTKFRGQGELIKDATLIIIQCTG